MTPGVLPKAGADEAPFALVANEARGQILTAVNRTARREGVVPGMGFADARARLPRLVSHPAELAADRTLLERLAHWAGRYGPSRNCDGTDGLWVDVTGVAHLFATPSTLTTAAEAALLADLVGRLARVGLTARTGLADTLGAAHALARYATDTGTPYAISPPGETRAALASLPVEALRLTPEAVLLLKRLGLSRIGNLYGLPRAALERRFRDKTSAAGALLRLDQALGHCREPRRPLAEPPSLSVRRSYAEPLISAEVIASEVCALAVELAHHLDASGLGARAIMLALYRTDASEALVSAGTSRASRDADHLFSLLKEKLDAVDAGFGIDALVLSAVGALPLPAAQAALAAGGARENHHEAAHRLVDRLANRLGRTRVCRPAHRASHIPERAATAHAALDESDADETAVAPTRAGPPRPPFLLPHPEAIEVVAEVPEGAPLRFTWRRRSHRIIKAEGPERIAPEWWRRLGITRPDRSVSQPFERARDYYRIEDSHGGRYWVFRAGRYLQSPEHDHEESELSAPAWYLHGVFP